jgi:SPP1 gp7 family putative phage head morphogenesis protein
MFVYSDKLVEALFKGVYTGKLTHKFLPKSLYYAIADYLKKGVYEGYGTSLSSLKATKMPSGFTMADKELLTELRTNIYLFSAAKTYQQVREMSSALIGEDGKTVSFKQFREKADQTYNLYNKVWLQTEYDTAIGQAQAARKWAEIERNADVLPLLEYSAVMDKRTSEICRPLDGIIAPVNDPIWKRVAPLNHFNCRCMLLPLSEGKQTSAKVKKAKVDEIESNMQDLFKMNPGIDGYVFSKAHPYFDVAPKDKALAKKNFNLDIPKKD